MARELNKVICIRVSDATYDKFVNLQKDKFPEMTVSEVARECVINGIARLESQNVKSKT